eukprot:TRINITY_DN3251_c0_g2_i2.p1 TRINITY_DN3251_c0_g2~~TRINITY_DN3251_c0_g2_i2.p1  ORF type:complete len:790 (-),score=160.36 TRINITY_DN3251_c0_g2_i2:3-2372(-)
MMEDTRLTTGSSSSGYDHSVGGTVSPAPPRRNLVSLRTSEHPRKLASIGRQLWREYVGTLIGALIAILFLIFVTSQIWWYEQSDSSQKDVASKSPIAWQAAIIGDWVQLILLIIVLALLLSWHKKHHSDHKLPLDTAVHHLKKAKNLLTQEFTTVVGGMPKEVQSEVQELDSMISSLDQLSPWLQQTSQGHLQVPFQTTSSSSSSSNTRLPAPLILISNLHRAKEQILTETLRLNTILEHLYYGVSDTSIPESDFQVLIQISSSSTPKADTLSIRSLEKARWNLLLQQDLLHSVVQECQHIEVDKLRGEQREARRAIESHEYESIRALKTLRIKHHSGGSSARPSAEPLESGHEGTSGGQLLFLLLAGGTAIYMLSLVVKWWVGDKNPGEDWNNFMKLLACVFPFHVLLLYTTVEYFTNVNPYSKLMPPTLKWIYKVFLQYLVWWNLTWAFIAIVLDYHSGFNSLLDSLGLAATIDFRFHVVAHLGELAAMKWFVRGKKGPAKLMRFILRAGTVLRDWCIDRLGITESTEQQETGSHKRSGFAAIGRSWALVLVGSLAFGFLLNSEHGDPSIPLGPVVALIIVAEAIVCIQLLFTWITTGYRKEPEWQDVAPKKLLQIIMAGLLFLVYQISQTIFMFVSGRVESPMATLMLSVSTLLTCYHLVVFYPRREYLRSYFPGLWVATISFMEIHNYLWLLIDVVTERTWVNLMIGNVFDAFGLAAAVNFRLLSASMYGVMTESEVIGVKSGKVERREGIGVGGGEGVGGGDRRMENWRWKGKEREEENGYGTI